jgi:SAM-dependent methyltransferase
MLLQSDMAAIPLLDGCCDAVFSFGAIAYTSDPSVTIRELARVLRPGGLFGLWIYPRPSGVAGLILAIVRRTCRIGGTWVAHRIADMLVPILQWLPTRSGMHLGNATWQQCREVVLVNIAPTQLMFPTRDDVLTWCTDAGLELEEENTDAPITLWLRRLGADT